MKEVLERGDDVVVVAKEWKSPEKTDFQLHYFGTPSTYPEVLFMLRGAEYMMVDESFSEVSHEQ